MTLIAQAYLYLFSIVNSKTLFIVCINSISISFEDGIARLYIDCESLSTGTSLYDSTPL